MFKNIFLASYPKSGNTWMRAIIANLYNFDKEFNLKTLKSIPLLSIKKNFDEFENKIFSDNNFCILTGYHKILLIVKKY